MHDIILLCGYLRSTKIRRVNMNLKRSKKLKRIVFIALLFAIIISVIVFFSHYTIINVHIYSYKTTNLDLSKQEITTMQESKLKKFKNLKVLNLRASKIRSLSFLNDMDELEELQLGNSSILSNKIDGTALNNISEMKRLRIVDLSSLENWDLNKIEKFKKLTFLEVSFSYMSLDAIDDITRVKSLEELDLAVSTIEDLTALKVLENLKTLDLYKAYLKDPSGLYELDQIVNLDIIDVQDIDVYRLADMRSLKRILIREEQIPENELAVLKDASIEIYYDSQEFYSDIS